MRPRPIIVPPKEKLFEGVFSFAERSKDMSERIEQDACDSEGRRPKTRGHKDPAGQILPFLSLRPRIIHQKMLSMK